MKKQGIPYLIILTVAFIAFTVGFYLGRNQNQEPVLVSIPPSMLTNPVEATMSEPKETTPEPAITFPIDINSAGLAEFAALPGIGDILAQRILDYRESHGAFSSVEDLLNVKGIGKLRFEEILDLIMIGG